MVRLSFNKLVPPTVKYFYGVLVRWTPVIASIAVIFYIAYHMAWGLAHTSKTPFYVYFLSSIALNCLRRPIFIARSLFDLRRVRDSNPRILADCLVSGEVH